MTFSIYYGQEGQDSIIKQFFDKKGVKNGLYLDVGSLDGIRFSNTLLLERDNWKGVCVEVHPSYAELLKKNRPLSTVYVCAAGDKDKTEVEISLNFRASLTTLDFDQEKRFVHDYEPWYGDRNLKEINGFLNGRHKVPMRTLNSILEEEKIKNLQLISIDIDGSEIYAFKGLNLKQHEADLLVLEWTVVGDNFCNMYAGSGGFVPVIKVGPDIFYAKTDNDIALLKTLHPIGTFANVAHPCLIGANGERLL